MAMPRTARAAEYARRIAVARVIDDGDTAGEAADLTGASVRSVRRWLRAYREAGDAGLVARPPGPGAPRKLAPEQEAQVLGWLAASPADFGFPTERWTAVRVAALIRHLFGVTMNPRYLNDWFARRDVTPQMPQRVPRERDASGIRAWVRHRWPRIKKKSVTSAGPWSSPMRVGSCSRRSRA